ncbi:MAG: ELWxxDGT repeat protein [Thermoanaerobaculia bacterium]
MKTFSKLALAALLIAAPAAAQVASLVRDITPQSPSYDSSAPNPYRLSAAGDRLVFGADDELHGGELWTSDGTPGGTEILEDLCPGECGSNTQLAGTTHSLSFWLLDDALWRTDGTRAGTFPLLDEVVVSYGAEPWALRGEVLYLQRCPYPGCGLWRSDGTVAGTRRVLDELVRQVAVVNDRVLAATDETLWRIEPGSETPVRVLDLRFAKFLAAVQGRLFLIVAESDGQELWSTDGTAAGTRALTKFANGDPFGLTTNFTATSRRLYFVADDIQHGHELWTSDGTPQGTKRITDFGFYFPFPDHPLERTLQETAGGRVVFAATDGLSDDLQLWSTDGRPESTTLLLKPCPRECNPSTSPPPPYRTARAGNTVLFPAVDAAHGIELWTTDGTAKGTKLFLDLCPGPCDSGVGFPASFPASPELWLTTRNHLWKTDGTVAGTRQITTRPLEWYELLEPAVAEVGGRTYVKLGDDTGGRLVLLEDGEVSSLTFGSGLGAGSEIGRLFAQGGKVHFAIEDGDEHGLWESAGTAETTRRLTRDVDAMENPVAAGGITYFFRYNELWRATDEGAVRIAEVSDDSYYETQAAAALGSLLYFAVRRDGASELWKTDGTAAGTVSVQTLPAGSILSLVAAAGARLYLGLYDEEESSQRLWTSDGTAAGSREIAVSQDYGFFLPSFVHAGAYDWFLESFGSDSETRLWRTDGTAAGTVRVPLAAGPVRLADGMIEHQGSLYVLGEDYDYPSGISGLWRVDGGTVTRLGTFGLRPYSRTLEIVSAAGLVLFSVDDGEHGIELWATDGTADGTRLVKDVAPGSFSSEIAELTAAAGKVFFSARDNVHGYELWQSDGTAAGTRLVQDIAPGPESSRPEWLTAAEGRLYFTADDGLAGRELWTLPLAGGPCQPSARILCLQGGRFRVEAAWRDFQRNTGAGTAVPLTGDTGYFWFFDPANAEVILKVLDGRGLNDHFWVFYGALSSVEYTLTVTDTQTGAAVRYLNPMGQLASAGDTTGFGPAGATASQSASQTAPASPPALVRGWTAAAPAPCMPGAQRLCLNGGRFGVEASWKDFAGKTGKGTAVPLTGDAGYFWFFDPANVEVLLKVLDGRPVTGRFWVFYGALSNVEYTLTVTDSLTGEVKEYRNPSGRFASVADTGAF